MKARSPKFDNIVELVANAIVVGGCGLFYGL